MHSFTEVNLTFGAINYQPPSPNEFHKLGGIDFGRLAEIYEDMKTRDIDPQIVIAPHLQSIDFWEELLYASRQYNAHNHPDTSSRKALYFLHPTQNHWDSLTQLPMDTPSFKNWTIRIIPAEGSSPSHDDGTFHRDAYPTVSEYLSMQAVRFRFDLPLLNETKQDDGPRTLLDPGKILEPSGLLINSGAHSITRQISLTSCATTWLASKRARQHKPEWQ